MHMHITLQILPFSLFLSLSFAGEDIFSSSSSAPPVPSTSPPPPLPVEKEETPSDLFSEQSSDAQMNLFSPGKENEVLVTCTCS